VRLAGLSEPTERNPELREKVVQLARVHPRYGFRRVHAFLPGVNLKAVVELDCFTRERLLLKAAPSFPAFEVQRELEWLFLVHGKPGRIVSDSGPEFRAVKLPNVLRQASSSPAKP
jgi:hypothetical protein